jgi:ornithine cyclodeaminase/alanine dehydrogenase-like protein (mu-crystallin family)
MALLLTEADVRELLTMPMALTAVEESFRRLASGGAIMHPRQRLHFPGKSYLHYMAAADATGGYMGLKIYSSAKEGLRFIVPLFNVMTGDLAAIIEADFLGQVRTGAASGVATRLMSRDDSSVVGIIGTGLQARTQLEAVAAVRKLDEVRVCGRDANRREKFVADMSTRLKVPVRSAANAEDAVRDADIVITSTTSTNPVVEGRWLKKGAHINAIGANFPQKRELDAEAVECCDVIAVDSREQSKVESGDLIQVLGEDEKRWSRVEEMSDIVSGKTPGRTNAEQITLFKSNGIAIEDIVVAGQIYELARQRKIGSEIPMWEKEARLGEARGV